MTINDAMDLVYILLFALLFLHLALIFAVISIARSVSIIAKKSGSGETPDGVEPLR